MKNSFCLVILIGALLALPASADLVSNGGAETGDLSGWTVDLTGASSGNTNIIAAVTSQAQSTGTVLPHAGDYFFTFANQAVAQVSNSGLTISMSQTGTSGLALPVLTLQGWIQTEFYKGADDTGEAVIALYGDAAETVLLGQASTGVLASHAAWSPFSASLANPGGADHWKVTLFGTENVNTYANVFYDDVQLVPVPGAVLLGMLGLSVAGVKLRKRA